MTIFDTKTLQHFFNRLGPILSRSQVEKLARELKLDDHALAAEWEISALSALMDRGQIVYEGNFGGLSNPDIHFRAQADINAEFVADIRATSNLVSPPRNGDKNAAQESCGDVMPLNIAAPAFRQ